MSAFLANHPLPPRFIANTVGIAILLLAAFAVTTLAAILRVDREAWPAAGHSRRRWVAIGVGGLVVLPVGAATSVVWRAKVRPAVLAASSKASAVRDPYRLFGAVTTFKGRAGRVAIAVIAAFSIIGAYSAVIRWSVGDPDTVYITDLGREIQPRPYIAAACPGAIRKTLHLVDPDVLLNHHDYQRWSVAPAPGHMDQVLLDPDSGHVICP